MNRHRVLNKLAASADESVVSEKSERFVVGHIRDKSIDLPLIKNPKSPQRKDIASLDCSMGTRLNILNVIEEARISRNHSLMEESKTDSRVVRRHLNVSNFNNNMLAKAKSPQPLTIDME